MTKSSPNNTDIDTGFVVRLLKQTHSRKSPGQICGKVLKTCAEQLGGICQHVIVECLEKQRIPVMWRMPL